MPALRVPEKAKDWLTAGLVLEEAMVRASFVGVEVEVVVEVEVGVFDDDVQPHMPMINAAMRVTNTANVNVFISLPPS